MRRLLVPALVALWSPAVAAQGNAMSLETAFGTGHTVQDSSLGCESTIHDTVPFELAARGRLQHGQLVVRVSGAFSAETPLAEDQLTDCLTAVGGGLGDPPADEPIGRGNVRLGVQGHAAIGASLRWFGIEGGLLAQTEPLWGSWVPPLLPMLAIRFGPPSGHAYLGLFDVVPTVTQGGMLRSGAAWDVGDAAAMDLGVVWGPDVSTFQLAGGGVFKMRSGAAVLATLRVGARLFLDDDNADLTGLPLVTASLGYRWAVN